MTEKIPEALQERIARLQQLQQTLQIVIREKQQLELRLSEAERALRELQASSDNVVVYKSVGPLLIRSTKDSLIKELEEDRELLNTRITVLAKQEGRMRETLKDLQLSIQEQLKALKKSSANL